MFFILSKALFFIINPLVWILGLIIFSLVIKQSSKWKKISIYSSIVLLIIFSNNYLFTLVGSCWEIPSKPASSVTGHYKYAVVLGGMGSENKKTGKFHVGQSIDRVLQAIIIYKQGKVEKIIITGGSGAVFGQGRREAPLIKKFCMDMGVPADDIFVEANSRNTHENAMFTKKMIGANEQQILLITSAMHMRRSIGCFEKEGFKFDYLATDPMIQPIIYFDDFFIPKGEAIYYWSTMIKEIVGTAVYKIVGYN
jgi:uncharacterized SAM-binding protein YcdF (DUF218 family)